LNEVGLGHLVLHDHRVRVIHGHVVDGEVTCWLLIAPTPDRLLIEHCILHDTDTSCHRVIGAVCFRSGLVPNEDHRPAAIVQLLKVAGGLDVGHASERAKMVDYRRVADPQLIQSPTTISLRRGVVQCVNHRCHSLSPELARELLGLEHVARSADDSLVLPLDDAILLWRVWSHQLPLNTKLGEVVD
jgi:hypothetical protein